MRKNNLTFLFFTGIFIHLLLINISAQETSFNTSPNNLEYHNIESDMVKKQTLLLQNDQTSVSTVDNGEEIVFAMDAGIYVQQADGSGRRLLVSKGQGYATFNYPAWSLDGRYIAFAAKHTDSRVVDLVIANADGSNPHVILTLNSGYYDSDIVSISWAWDNEHIMFSFYYDDANLNVVMVACTIRKNGTELSIGAGLDQSFCKYEPVTGSSRYAYISAGSAFDMNSKLQVSNLDGTNNEVWFTFYNVISGLTYVEWNNPNSIYIVIRWWDAYPNQEVLLRVDKNGSEYSAYKILYSEINANILSPALSPGRNILYTTELTNEAGSLWQNSFYWNGTAINLEKKGLGFNPNWRQKLPAPEKPVLKYPENNSEPTLTPLSLSWEKTPLAAKYELLVSKYSNFSTNYISKQDLTETNYLVPVESDVIYYWKVRAVNDNGKSEWSDTFSFTLRSTAIEGQFSIIPKEFKLGSNYPNPFNPITTIPFALPVSANVLLEVYDINGKHVAVIINRRCSAGFHKIVFDAAYLSSGVYFYKITAKSTTSQIFSKTCKMFILK